MPDSEQLTAALAAIAAKVEAVVTWRWWKFWRRRPAHVDSITEVGLAIEAWGPASGPILKEALRRAKARKLTTSLTLAYDLRLQHNQHGLPEPFRPGEVVYAT